jgi:uncharacterized repeat protein (TIGR03803 family)
MTPTVICTHLVHHDEATTSHTFVLKLSPPQAGVVLDSSGDLFGTTSYGGKNNTGVVFKLTP